MEPNYAKIGNSKYCSIIKEIVKPEFQSKLLEWCGKISQEHKQGLHVIKTVVDLRGMKRFKKKGDNADAMSTTNALSVDLTNQA